MVDSVVIDGLLRLLLSLVGCKCLVFYMLDLLEADQNPVELIFEHQDALKVN